MTEILSLLSSLLPHAQPWRSLMRAAVMIIIWLALLPPIEFLHRRSIARYKTSAFAIDLAYVLFYEGGVYTLLVSGPLVAWIQPQLAGMNLNLLGRLPLPVAFIAFMLLTDFTGYWLPLSAHESLHLGLPQRASRGDGSDLRDIESRASDRAAHAERGDARPWTSSRDAARRLATVSAASTLHRHDQARADRLAIRPALQSPGESSLSQPPSFCGGPRASRELRDPVQLLGLFLWDRRSCEVASRSVRRA